MKSQVLEPALIHLKDVRTRELFPGFVGRFIHSTHMTHAYWEIKQGAEIPEHSHPHEQVVNILSGSFQLRVASVPHDLEPGQIFVVPPNVPHAGKAITDCRVLDVFSPPREDYF